MTFGNRFNPAPLVLLTLVAAVGGCGARDRSAVGPDYGRNVRLVSDDAATATAAPTIPGAPATPPAAPAVTIEIVPKDGATSTGPGAGTFDFGEISQVDTAPIKHTFFLRNPTAKAITIDRVQPSCGCTTAVLAGQKSAATNGAKTVIDPGQSVALDVSIDRSHLIPGHNVKTIWIYTVGQAQPAATIQMAAIEQAAASLEPTSIDFGRVQVGQAKSEDLTLTVDPRYPNADKLAPKLQPDTDDITVTPIDTHGDKRRFRVSISPRAHIGNIEEMVVVGPAADGHPLTALASVTGTVAGDVIAEPMSIAFGAVAAHTSALQSVMLKATRPGVLSGVTVKTESRYLDAKLMPDGASSGGAIPSTATSAVLQVTLEPAAPAGALESHVVVTTAGGQTMALPVWAFVGGPLPAHAQQPASSRRPAAG